MATAALKSSDMEISNFVEDLTRVQKALADSLRLQILRLLKNESFGVLELCRILDIRQSALSHHLKVLSTACLVSTRREGNSIFYRRAFLADEDKFRDIKRSTFDVVDNSPVPDKQAQKIKQIQLERAELSLSFFNRNSDKFKEQQGLIVEHGDYSASVHDIIDNLGMSSNASVLEVGPGEGEFLVELAEKFKTLCALDNSKDMLEKSHDATHSAQHSHVNFVLGDTGVARNKNISADLIIFNMVLHHISSPAKTFKDSAQLLNESGYLLIIDLGSHDQDWVRESCGDLWLGFDNEDLDYWANKAGLTTEQSSYLGLRNGFQIQMRVFKKPAR
jgi:DNA-binding transcriptional ArsR family regulator/SAM-dependent methyltransferase